jgi:iron complex transport system substrate-binding protein
MHLNGLRGPLVLVSALFALVVAAGCGGSESDSSGASAGGTPQRIVSLSPTATEGLFAIGAGEDVVAVDEQSDFPPAVPQSELSGFQPNVEAIAGYEPDLVVASAEGTEAAARGLRKLGVEVLVQPAAATLGQAYEQIRELGRITGHEEEADAVTVEMRERIAAAIGSAPDGSGLRVYHELSPDYFSADSSTFIGLIYGRFGLDNVADGAAEQSGGYPQLSAEHIVKANPDLIVLADVECCGQSPATVRRRDGWGGVAALGNGGLIAIDDDIASRWGPRVPVFAERVAAALAAVREQPGE